LDGAARHVGERVAPETGCRLPLLRVGGVETRGQ
jgi:hypothetical protein